MGLKAAPALLERQQKLQKIQELKKAVDRVMLSYRPPLGIRLAFDVMQALPAFCSKNTATEGFDENIFVLQMLFTNLPKRSCS